MAVTRKTQNDIGNYKPKLIGPFTTRQCIFIGIGLVPAFLTGYIMIKVIGTDVVTAFAACFLIMVSFVYIGSANPHGMKPEEFLLEYYNYHIASPGIRKYETVTMLDEMNKKEQVKEKKEKPVHKPNPDFPEYD